jgi:hypothetical protein
MSNTSLPDDFKLPVPLLMVCVFPKYFDSTFFLSSTVAQSAKLLPAGRRAVVQTPASRPQDFRYATAPRQTSKEHREMVLRF